MSEETKQEKKGALDVCQEFGINIQQKKFCEYFCSPGEFFGNGSASYEEAYEVDKENPNWRQVVRNSASEALKRPNVCKYINHLLEEGGLNDQFVDKQLLLLITQNGDFTNKLGAIREYNKIKDRTTNVLEVRQVDVIRPQRPTDEDGEE